MNGWIRLKPCYSTADSKDFTPTNRSRGRLGKQRSLLRQVSLREDVASEPNLSNSEAESSVAGSTVSINVGGLRGGGGGSPRSLTAANLLRKSGICESCVQVR